MNENIITPEQSCTRKALQAILRANFRFRKEKIEHRTKVYLFSRVETIPFTGKCEIFLKGRKH
jgi:hypothetical protein